MTDTNNTSSILVMGVGNTLWADEGIGPRLIDAMTMRHAENGFSYLDGGTQGLYLLPHIINYDKIIIFDAVSLGRKPGEVVVLRDDEVEAVFSTRVLSLHQTTLQDLLASTKMVGWNPQQIVLIGIEAVDTETWGGTLTNPVRQSMDLAMAEAEKILAEWGVTLTPCDASSIDIQNIQLAVCE